MANFISKIFCLLATCSLILTACEGPQEDITPQDEKDETSDSTTSEATEITLKGYSITPPLLKKLAGFEDIKVMTLISSEDQLEKTPGFIYGGSADGMGLLKSNHGYSLIVNHENNFSVSRITLNKSFKPEAGEYILNSSGGIWRLCSSTLAMPEEHGFGPVYLTCGESSSESQIHALNPFVSSSGAGFSKAVPALGRWSAENAVPLPVSAFPNRTAILIGDDETGTSGGQLAMYITNEGRVGDLTGETGGEASIATANVYVLRRVDLNPREMDLTEGQEAAVEFALINNSKDIKTMTGTQINAKATEINALAFGRVEDIDYRKGGGANGREIYFNVPGHTGNTDRSKYGRVYKLVLNENNPLSGTLTLVLDGDNDAGKANMFQNPDNILVTTNYAYIQEDPNGYGNETHDAYLYQYNLSTGELKIVFEIDHRRDDPKFMATATKGNWEYGAFIDISGTIGVENTFLLNIQPHTWEKDYFRNPDGGSIRPNEKQGSQTLIIQGLPR